MIMLVYRVVLNIQDGGQWPEVVRILAISQNIVVVLNETQAYA